ncbi:MAG TPA: ABC transporter permease, partial [Longimicrobiaceae bacterium]|nr:ABC transporter permease [Longimicrobiaceae bacterium]
METLIYDLRYAVRSLKKRPAFTLAALLTLMLGIGGTTAMVSLINAMLLRPLPVRQPDELVSVYAQPVNGPADLYFSYPDYEELRSGSTGAALLSAFGLQPFNIGVGEAATTTVGAFATANYFNVLGIAPERGRFFLAQEGEPGAEVVVVLSHDLWKRRFGADPSIVGQTTHLNGQPATVIGVAPERFNGTISLVGIDFWVPTSAYPLLLPDHDLRTPSRWLQVFGRRAPGIQPKRLEASLTAAAKRFTSPGDAQGRQLRGMSVKPLQGLVGEARQGAWRVSTLLFVTALLVLAIASLNVAGMLLAGAASRRGEIAVRLAMGADRGRLLRQLLTESALLWLLGGLCGALLAIWLVRLLPALIPVEQAFPMRLGLDLRLDGRVLAFTLALSLVTGITFGLSPALQSLKLDLVSTLKDRTTSGQRLSGRRNTLVTVQVAASFVLLVVAGLFLRAVQHAYASDPGFDPDGVTVGVVDLGNVRGYPEARGRELYATLLSRLRARPEVQSVSLASQVPLDGSQALIVIRDPSSMDANDGLRTVPYSVVGPDYFRTLRIPLAQGREFTAADRAGTATVAVVSEGMARKLWGTANPVGKTIQIGSATVYVVGVAKDVQSQTMGEVPPAFLYLSFGQRYAARLNVLVRAHGQPVRLISEEVRGLDPNLPLAVARPFREMIVTLMPQRIIAILMGTFGFFGLLLAAVGIYGVVAYSVAQRSPEIAVRMAVGAQLRDVLWLVLRQGVVLVAVGVGFGIAATFSVSGVLRNSLAGQSATDPVVVVAVVLTLLCVTVAACYFPARRAGRI